MDVKANSTSDNDTCESELTQSEKDIVLYIYGGMGGLSSLFCILGLILVLYWRQYRRFTHRLVLYQLMAALVFSLICTSDLLFINYSKNVQIYEPICAIVGYVLTMAIWAKLLFTFWLTFYLFVFAVCFKDLRQLELLYIITSIGFPLLVCWIPFLHNLYGVAGAWCWIKNWKGECDNREKLLIGTIEQYVFLVAAVTISFIIILIFISVTVLALLCRIYCKNTEHREPLLKQQRERQKKAVKEIIPLMTYPLIFLISFSPPIINRIYGDVVKKDFLLFVLHAVFGPSWGILVGSAVAVHTCLISTAKKSTVQCHATQGNDPVLFTYDTVASTGARTEFFVSNESGAQ